MGPNNVWALLGRRIFGFVPHTRALVGILHSRYFQTNVLFSVWLEVGVCVPLLGGTLTTLQIIPEKEEKDFFISVFVRV